MHKDQLSVNQQRLMRKLLLGHFIAEPTRLYSYYQLRDGKTRKIIGDVNKLTFDALVRRNLIIARQTLSMKKWVAA